jgi:anti-sigma factor RsiW
MNREKAREFFSSYAEGTLDAGLRHSLEQRLKQDFEIKAEFEAFQRTMEELDALRFLSAPVPDDLHDKIAARLDLQVWEQKRSTSIGWAGWLRNLAMGGVAAAAVLGAVLSIISHSSTANAGGISGFAPNQLQATPADKGVRVSYIASTPRAITVQSGDQVLRLDHLASNQRWESTLTNSQPHAALFRIAVPDEAQALEVSVPGTTRVSGKAGYGTIEDLAKALSDTYRVPVILDGHALNERVKWDLQDQDVSEAAGTALKARGYTVEIKSGNALWITQN